MAKAFSVRTGLRFLLLGAILANCLPQPASAYYFEHYVTWANGAFNGGPSSPSANCSLAAVAFLDFVYAVVKQAAPTVGTAQLTATCLNCSAALDAAFAYLPNSSPATCSLLPSAATSNLTAVALRRFVCFGFTALDEGAGAGTCVVKVVKALSSVGLLEPVRSMAPNLTFAGPSLPALCEALFPASPSDVSCCPRTWSILMAGLAQQSCLGALAHEYIALPGRCEAVLNRTVPGFCDASWPSDLWPLLQPPQAEVCSGGGRANGTPPAYLNGSACSTSQLTTSQLPGSTCDLWCGVIGEMDRIATGEIPGPEDEPNKNGTTSDTTPPSQPGDGGGGGGGGDDLTTATIVIVCVFSVLIFLLLVAIAIFGWRMYREKKALLRDQYSFDKDIGAAVAAEEEVAKSTAETRGAPPAAPNDSAPPTPVASRSVTIPAAAAAAAAAGSVDRTPKYNPGPPPASASPAAAAATGGAARVLVFGEGGGGMAAAAAAGGVDSASRSSRYESATSLFDKSLTGLTRYSTPPGGLDGSLSPAPGGAAAAAAAAGAGAAGSAGAASPAVHRLRSHRLSLTDSEFNASLFQTAHSRFDSTANMGPESSGSLMTVRSTNANGSIPVGGGGGGLSSAQSGSALALVGTPP